jgi:peptidoglycan hydrolase-like protein with peptidoglycan-binding domain
VSGKAVAIMGGVGLALLMLRKKTGEEDTGAPPGAYTPGGSSSGGSSSGGSSSGGGSSGGWYSQSAGLPQAGWAATAGVPDSVIEKMARAVATNDPEAIRAAALELNQAGYNQQAEDLLRAAELIEQAGMVTDPMTGMAIPSNTVPPTAYPNQSTAPIPGSPSMPDPNVLPVVPLPPNPLRKGATGPNVKSWQNALRATGFGAPKTAAIAAALPAGSDPEVKPDGVFGAATDTATRLFQLDHGLQVDGIVGPKTAAAVGKQPVLGARLLKLGKRGPAVKVWQAQLVKDGFGHVPIDGIFGPVTDTATREWQRARKLGVDGAIGPKTIAAIGTNPAPTTPVPSTSVVDPDKWRTMRRGTAGKDVAEWQMVLTRDGYGPLVADGKFGPATEEATKQWQLAHKLTADGIVGQKTRDAIDDGSPGPGALATRVMGDTDLQPFRAPAQFKPYSPLPGLIPLAVPDEVVPADRSLAARFAQHVYNVKPGDEDRDFVREFQRAHGLNDSGAYGPATALALVPYGIVPAKPFYWPRKGLQKVKATYRVTLMQQSNRDPQRRDEWAAAANV